MTMGWMRPNRHWLAFTAIVFLYLPARHDTVCVTDPGPGSSQSQNPVDESLYAPVEAEIRAEYQRDLSNQKVQTWREYWEWVQSFYKGNLLADGWTKYCQTTLAAVKADGDRRVILTKINRLGKVISQEWAKDGRVRRITTMDLRRWNDEIGEARRTDDGSGQGIKKAIDTIHEQAEKQLAG
jgi:hypothetical protein